MLIPVGTRYRMWYLELLINYVDGIINGDDIRQYTTSKYMTSLARNSLEEIMHDVQAKVLSSYREERSELKSKVESLLSQRQLLEESIERLLFRKDELFTQNTSLGEEVTRLSRQYENLKNNGMNQIEEEFRERKESLELELIKLRDEKDALSNSVSELKRLLDNYTSIIREISKPKGRCEVTWETIDKDHPIYRTNYNSIKAFIESLKMEYMDNMHVSEDICEREFAKHAPTLNVIYDNLINLNRKDPIFSSINNLDKNFGGLFDSEKLRFNQILTSLSILKLPKYRIVSENIDSISVNANTLPNNLQSMLRELHFQRIALEAVSKQKILEAELETVLGVLQSVVPDDYDFTSMNERLRSLEDKLGDENKLTL